MFRKFLLSSLIGTLFVYGKLVGHFPVCDCLRVTVAAIKQYSPSVSSGWDNEVRDATLRSITDHQSNKLNAGRNHQGTQLPSCTAWILSGS